MLGNLISIYLSESLDPYMLVFLAIKCYHNPNKYKYNFLYLCSNLIHFAITFLSTHVSILHRKTHEFKYSDMEVYLKNEIINSSNEGVQ